MYKSQKPFLMAVLAVLLCMTIAAAEENGDMNCDGSRLDIADLVYAVNYMFNGGPAPCEISGFALPFAGPTDFSYNGAAMTLYNTHAAAAGLIAQASGNYATALMGWADTGTRPWGVYGVASGTEEAFGVRGEAGGPGVNAGVYGLASPTTGVPALSDISDYSTGVLGRSSSIGMIGLADTTGGFGIYGYGSVGIAGEAAVGTDFAGYFAGSVHATAGYSGSKGSLVIDHPQDPESKMINHSFVASPTDLLIYDGRTELDDNGQATVEMPDYFAALADEDNARIQMTPVGRPFLIGAEWLSGTNAFVIYGEPNRSAYWQVSADRDDPVAMSLACPVVVDKTPEGKLCTPGKYLYPEAFGQPRELTSNRLPRPTTAVERGVDPRISDN
ncbi:MAG: hypothetical protein ABIE70_04950 [bacterium]